MMIQYCYKINYFLILIAIYIYSLNVYSETSWNDDFIGIWEGRMKTTSICTSKSQDSGGYEKITIKILDTSKAKVPHVPQMSVISGWGCFGLMTLNGLSFSDELWASTKDNLSYVKFTIKNSNRLSGEFRFDLNGYALKADFKNFQRTKIIINKK